MKALNLTNQRFGKLVVIEKSYVKNTNSYWLCKCDCGKETIVALNNLRRNHTTSCGCIAINNKSTQNQLSNTRLYRIYWGVKQRCYNLNNVNYKNYGKRGIKVCDEWLNDFQAFYDWSMKNGYRDDLSIDRINNDGNYEPSNCRWVTIKEQQNNRRNNRLVKVGNITKTISEWSKELNVNKETIRININKNPNYIESLLMREVV